jgi:CHAT domain-containing protein
MRVGAIAAVLFATALAVAGAPADVRSEPPTSAPDARELKPDQTASGEIAGTQRHGFDVALKSGDYLGVRVDQKGIDLVLGAHGPDGRLIVETDFRATADGTDWLSVLAEADGLYRITLRPRLADAATGRYELRLTGPRPASPGDRACARGDHLLAEGHALWREGSASSLETATVRIEAAAAAYEEAQLPGVRARALGDAGIVHWRLGHPARALELYAQSLPIRRALHDRRGEALVLSNMGIVYKSQGRIRDALSVFTEAMGIWRDIGDRQGEGLTLHNIASTHIYMAEYPAALDALRKALALSRESRSRSNEALILTTLGGLHSALGEFDTARPLLVEARQAYQTLGDRRGEGLSLSELAWVDVHTGRVAEAIRNGEESVRLLQGADALSESLVRARLGDAYLIQGRLGPAVSEFEAVRTLARQGGSPNNEAGGLVLLALARSMEGRGEEARRLLDEVRPLVESAGPSWGAASQRHVMGDVLRRLGDLEAARRETAIAVGLVDSYRAAMGAPDLRANFLATVHAFYERHAGILMRLHDRDPRAGHAAAALETIERGRARTLVELLTEGHQTVRDDLPAELLRREQDALARITALQIRLLDRPSATSQGRAARVALGQELESAERQRQEVEEEIRRASPRYASIRYPRSLSVPDIQALLDPDTALCEYSLGEAPYLFVVTREGITTHRLAAEATVSREVGRLREAVRLPSRTRRGAYLRAGRRLYDLLIAPARAELATKRRLVIVPDRSLAYLPFEALLAEDVPATTLDAGLPYLLRRFSVAYVPSASTLASLRQRRSEAKGSNAGPRKEVVAFADPTGWTSEPPHDPPADTPSESPLRGMLEDAGLAALKALPDSRREAEDLKRSLGPEAVRVFVGADATEENVKTSPEVATARRLHFATHALVSAKRPNHSALVLSRTPGGREDGLLQGFEIFDLKLQADLVVLSACETGLGQELRGEGVIGLTRAFLHAGADRVAATLWEVADRSTADLMSAFYRQVAGAAPASDALRKAKLKMVAGGRYAHPYYWAAFVLVGEP